mmetsp:Transcript_7562/g.24165  ORF Transcript_7562/g.24165 Transcript_7562/m.24165 type:complete len:102 (-) Transcript_7562:134-439(-)
MQALLEGHARDRAGLDRPKMAVPLSWHVSLCLGPGFYPPPSDVGRCSRLSGPTASLDEKAYDLVLVSRVSHIKLSRHTGQFRPSIQQLHKVEHGMGDATRL